ncbi:MAG: helix-turn-helix transcriptional regulator [Roseitalea sp.]|nr:helix-turn-helix transcriptional regulator [Roseitalea sp.]MBO6722293.1 helix-turn-helix transcriptional regulator [Roseitalea sp.]MBO6742377.1 helix-turn-helix transcriptional regulator [Roseitalea sp.]
MLEPFQSRGGLLALLALQAVCAVFLVYDAGMDILQLEQRFNVRESDTLEYLIVLALVLSLAMTFRQFRALLTRNRHVEARLQAASGAFQALLDDHFAAWELTVSERDVALLAIKGLGIGEIASVRQTREGTVKAQLAAIYRKAGVSGRPQLISLFVEELMGEPLVGAPG